MGNIKTVGIVGAGALGVMYGQKLQQNLGRERLYMIADEARVARYRRDGLFCNGAFCDFQYRSAAEAAPVDLLIFAVKFPALAEALAEARPFIQAETIFLSVLNGIASEERIAAAFGAQHLLYCMVYGMDAQKQDNQVHYRHIGAVVFGDCENRPTADVSAVARLLDEAAVPYEIPPDIMHQLWNKLMLNAGVNQVAALLGETYGGLSRPGQAQQLMLETMQEVRQIAALEGVTLTEAEIAQWLEVLKGLNPEGRPSMAQDIRAGRGTELELFAGAVRRLGQKHGLPTPCNDTLYEGIRRLEAQNRGE